MGNKEKSLQQPALIHWNSFRIDRICKLREEEGLLGGRSVNGVAGRSYCGKLVILPIERFWLVRSRKDAVVPNRGLKMGSEYNCVSKIQV